LSAQASQETAAAQEAAEHQAEEERRADEEQAEEQIEADETPADAPAPPPATAVDPSVTITTRTEDGIVWVSGAPGKLCYTIPAASNTAVKHLVVWVDPTSARSYYKDGLIGAGPETPVPTASQACVDATPSEGLPPAEYRVALQDDQFNILAESEPFRVGSVQMYWNSATFLSSGMVRLRAYWKMAEDLANPHDVIKVHDNAGKVVAWWFTSCGCDTSPDDSHAVYTGEHNVELQEQTGGFTFKFYPGGKDLVGGTDMQWINWKSYGM